MLSKLRKKTVSTRKKEYFTIMILPGPNSRVRKFSISKTLLRNVGYSILAASLISVFMVGDYFHMRSKVWELNILRVETKKNREQLQQFATNLVDMKGEMARLKEMDTKLRSLAKMGGRDGGQLLGRGGSNELTPVNLDELGRKTHQEVMEQMNQELDNLKGEAAMQEVSMRKLAGYFEHRNSVLSATPDIWPVRGFVTSDFGYRNSPIYGTRQFHEGLDIANRVGTRIVAPANGTVAETGYQAGYGRYILIQHGYGMATLYGHLSRVDVKNGQRVQKGDCIGAVGNSGSSTGSHLHYEVRINGVPTNPKKYL